MSMQCVQYSTYLVVLPVVAEEVQADGELQTGCFGGARGGRGGGGGHETHGDRVSGQTQEVGDEDVLHDFDSQNVVALPADLGVVRKEGNLGILTDRQAVRPTDGQTDTRI
jgi:hypothetical protein